MGVERESVFEGQEVKDLFGREKNGGEEGGQGDGRPLWESLGRHSPLESALPSPFLGEVSHFSESGNILSLRTRAKSYFLPLSQAPSSPHIFICTTLDHSSQRYSWSPSPLPPDQCDTVQQAWQGHEMRDGARAVTQLLTAPALSPSYPARFSGPLAVAGTQGPLAGCFTVGTEGLADEILALLGDT